MLFRECSITHETWEEPIDRIGCFPVPLGIQVIGELLESLLIPVGSLQPLCNLFLVFPRNIPQDGPGTVDRIHLPGCAEDWWT